MIIKSVKNSEEEQRYQQWAKYELNFALSKEIKPIIDKHLNYSENTAVFNELYDKLDEFCNTQVNKTPDIFKDIHFEYIDAVPNGDKEAVVKFKTDYGIHGLGHSIEFIIFCTMNIDEAKQLTKGEYTLTGSKIKDWKKPSYRKTTLGINLGEFLILDAHATSVKTMCEIIYNR